MGVFSTDVLPCAGEGELLVQHSPCSGITFSGRSPPPTMQLASPTLCPAGKRWAAAGRLEGEEGYRAQHGCSPEANWSVLAAHFHPSARRWRDGAVGARPCRTRLCLSYHQRGPAAKVFHFPSLQLELTTEENRTG